LRVRGGKGDSAVLETSERSTGSGFETQYIANRTVEAVLVRLVVPALTTRCMKMVVLFSTQS